MKSSSKKIRITLPDGTQRQYEAGVTLAQLLEDKGEFLAARVDGQLIDLTRPIEEDATVQWVTFDDEAGRHVYWHSTSHVMAQAVLELFPGTKLGIGPSIEDGFYYDFDREIPFGTEELEKIENRMTAIIEADLPFQREVMPREDAARFFEGRGEPYKVELIGELGDDEVSIYRQGDFVDLCRGPHLPSTGWIRSFKLLSVAGAYWRGDERNPMLQRIYGTSYLRTEGLKAHLEKMEEAKRRDHRRLGQELGLFSIYDEAGAGLVYWHPKGTIIREAIEDFWKKEHRRRGYQLTKTPHIARAELWHTSGHYDYYRQNMYVLDVDDREYVLKPMNCPGHILIYKSTIRSYQDLPLRYAELGTVYRHERSGVLHGLLRVRGFTIDDAHIFCSREQLVDELLDVMDLADFMMKTFGYGDYSAELSVRDPLHPDDYAGSLEEWAQAEEALAEVLKRRDLSYARMEGEAVFYGPKIDIKLVDALGRRWQGPTIQFDFNVPHRFQLTYIGPDGAPHRVYMIHRAILGSMERFVGGLIEHYAGAFPVWLAPVQAVVLPIAQAQRDYARAVVGRLDQAGVRVFLDDRREKVGYKIREGESQKVPYMLVVGKREEEEETVSIRKRGRQELGNMRVAAFLDVIQKDIRERTIW